MLVNALAIQERVGRNVFIYFNGDFKLLRTLIDAQFYLPYHSFIHYFFKFSSAHLSADFI